MTLTSMKTTDDLVKDLDVLSRELEKLKASYAQYFLGLERIEPEKLRAQVVTLIKKYASVPIQSARAKFRYNQLVQKYNTYTTYWDRILREIEEGKYERDVFRAKIHEKAQGSKPQAAAPSDPLEAVYNTYVAEKKKNKEELGGLSLDKFRAQMTAQMDLVRKKVGDAEVKLHVVTEAGKTKIKAIPQAKSKTS
jgi:hypothetical protein